MVIGIKIDDDAPLSRYLVKHLQPLSEADPNLLANYVVALLKNNKPKKELQKLCVEQLHDFLGEGTKDFVLKLFHALEDGTIEESQDAPENSKLNDAATVPTTGDITETMNSPSDQPEKVPTTNVEDSINPDEGTDDEDDDRNHKHRRRVTRSRSFERDGEEEDERGPYRKRIKQDDNDQSLRDNNLPVSEAHTGSSAQMGREGSSKYERWVGRDHGYRGATTKMNVEVNRGVRGVVAFRSDVLSSHFDSQNGLICGSLGRGRGGGSGGLWSSHEQRYPPFDGPDFNLSILPPGPPSIFPGRIIPGHGNPPHSPWRHYGHLSGIGNGSLDQALSLNSGMQAGRAVPISASIGVGMNVVMGMTIGRPRCPDFEERGYCLRGDLCPMEHGANRIVVEDVQSLSQFNLPVTLPSVRGMGLGPATVPTPVLPSSGLGFSNRALRETFDEPAFSNGSVACKMTSEPDLYDPDQPLWNHPEAGGGMRRLPPLRRGQDEHDWDTHASDHQVRSIPDDGEAERCARVASVGLQSGQWGSSVWGRVGPADHGKVQVDGLTRSLSNSGEVPNCTKFPKTDMPDQQIKCKMGTGFGKLEGDLDPENDNFVRVTNANAHYGKGQTFVRGETGANTGEDTSYGSRAGGSRGSRGVGPERAQRTLYVSCIPVSNNRRENLLAHFQKFGEILDVRIPAQSDRAFVQFSRREDADAALLSPEAVMGNRFIRLAWANRDSIPNSVESNASANGHAKSSVAESGTQGLPPRGREKIGGGPFAIEANVIENAGKLPGPHNQPSLLVAMNQKKQEELEQMKEELRRKQEKLAQKRDDFRRKLDQLSRQGVGVKGDLGTPQLHRKSEETEIASPYKSGSSEVVSVPTEAGQSSFEHSIPGRPAMGDTSKQAIVTGQIFPSDIPQPSPARGVWSPFPRPGGAVWSSIRYKLDNRTTIFRILPPYPDCHVDIATLKEHYSSFGELTSVELEDTEGQKTEGSEKLTDKSVVRVTFASRRAAERAFIQGRWFHGMSLQLVWYAPASSLGVVTPAACNKQGDGCRESPLFHLPKLPAGATPLSENELAEERKHIDGEDISICNSLPAVENLVEMEGVQLMHGMNICGIQAGQVQRCSTNASSDVGVKLDGDNLGIHTESASVKPVS